MFAIRIISLAHTEIGTPTPTGVDKSEERTTLDDLAIRSIVPDVTTSSQASMKGQLNVSLQLSCISRVVLALSRIICGILILDKGVPGSNHVLAVIHKAQRQ